MQRNESLKVSLGNDSCRDINVNEPVDFEAMYEINERSWETDRPTKVHTRERINILRQICLAGCSTKRFCNPD